MSPTWERGKKKPMIKTAIDAYGTLDILVNKPAFWIHFQPVAKLHDMGKR
jgi:hypothetical protein